MQLNHGGWKHQEEKLRQDIRPALNKVNLKTITQEIMAEVFEERLAEHRQRADRAEQAAHGERERSEFYEDQLHKKVNEVSNLQIKALKLIARNDKLESENAELWEAIPDAEVGMRAKREWD